MAEMTACSCALHTPMSRLEISLKFSFLKIFLWEKTTAWLPRHPGFEGLSANFGKKGLLLWI